MDWKPLLASITGSVDEELRLRNAYLATENRILRHQIKGGRVQLTDAERQTLAEMGQKLGRQALEEIATVAKPDTILAWHRKFVAQTCDNSQQRTSLGRPRIDQELEALVICMAHENRSWGYDRIVGALANLGYTVSDQTVGNILKRHGIPPAPKRKKTTTWQEFIRIHMDILMATDFFTLEVWTWCGLVTAALLFCIHVCRRKVHAAGMMLHLQVRWRLQTRGQATRADGGFLSPGLSLRRDRDRQNVPGFQQLMDAAGMTWVPLPPRPPDVNRYAERWVRSVKRAYLFRLILYGERALRHAPSEVPSHDHQERPHQGRDNVILMPSAHPDQGRDGLMCCCERLGGLLNYGGREAA
jgi:hypothetical protein